ncbi:rod shape-determining protein RodA [Pseudidiomarina terrestris]|uniref:Peptidoglycan glycosyltransferase MrdB n=1 Tax=Pseudidiomarina terrestris TaxID=2820060 RepID=A0AAW7QW75_9GAMM|nr:MULTISPECIES: rod shape-determining protein RodA [unclassified Pseudidiomarina]MDN7123338.1 rod shape-determining protein RodA [Pseudidiomarina sp. 1APP75-32.1]MDN7127830.1 rod shape-determining protein RodA [Pseudidiomarina sp. 1APR75-33.1]MDN7128937.1 rod shape-determining protein RodA [Pseudidiomarina sp. 1APR75-15]MDN7134800.1 rod shape-determining protein RodA [Pseudidiomarina sp. 1ASP75-5]MDN7137478.1 rod shape-determining protein RodA [Pseudidiomarina sp. 1ASP75-14]
MHPDQQRTSILQRLHMDAPLLIALLITAVVSIVTVYSASGEDLGMTQRQAIRVGAAFFAMFVIAQIPLDSVQRWSLPLFSVGIVLLLAVLLVGESSKGAQRWLDLGVITIQPSELMKLAVPMAVAWFISEQGLPPTLRRLAAAFILLLIPVLMIAKQPDLGTSLLIACSGIFVLFLAGMSWKLITFFAVAIGSFTPILWIFLMRDYQRQRVLTFLDPERDPLGAGYQIIQSKIAIGSGGIEGKGWLQGTQSQLEFLPERHTDFIFSVFSEEFGLVGVIGLFLLYGFIIFRGMIIAMRAQRVYQKLLAGSLTLTFFIYVMVNVGMVSGLLPVVGVPLPLISYGGTSMVTLLAGFGLLMAIATNRRLIHA